MFYLENENLVMRRNIYFSYSFLLLLIFSLTAFPGNISAQNVIFTGIVKDGSTGKPLKDAHVFIANSTFQSFTDSLGGFSIANISDGRWEISAKKEGFEMQHESILVKKNGNSTLEILLKPLPEQKINRLNLSDKKREKLIEEFLTSFYSGSQFKDQIRFLNPEALIFSEMENSKSTLVNSEDYLIFVNDQTGFLYTLYLLKPFEIGQPILKENISLTFLDLINEVPELISERTSIREKILSISPEFYLRQMLTGELNSSSGESSAEVSFGKFPGEYLLKFNHPLQIDGKGSLSYSGEDLALRAEGSPVFEEKLILGGNFEKIHPFDKLPLNFNSEKILKLANVEKNAQVMQEKVFLQTDRKHYLRGETLFFKANMIYSNPLLADELSKVLHVEILDITGYQEYHQVFPIISGKSMGSIFLPIGLNQKNYILRAYTSWSLNYGDESSFYLPIQVHDPSIKPAVSMPAPISSGVSIFSDKQTYSAGEDVNLNIMVRDKNGKPVSADLSISVLDLNQAVPMESRISMDEEFQLPPVAPNADLKDFTYPLETRYTAIGEIKDENNKPLEGDVTALINSMENIEKFKVSKDGTFTIPNLTFDDEFEIAIQAKNKDALPIRNIDLEIQDFPTERDLSQFQFPEMTSTQTAPLTAKEIQENMQQGEILLDEFVINEEKADPVGPMVYGEPDNSVDPATLPLNGSTSQFIYLLAGQVAGMNVSGTPPSISFRNGGEPLIMIDGVPINPPSGPMIGGGSASGRTATDIIAGINVFAIKRVEVIKRTVSMLGEGGRNGIISFIMKSGAELEEANEAMSNSFKPFKLSGFPKLKKFETVIEAQAQEPLLRGLKPTLYWNPEIITSEDVLSQKVTFKSSLSGGPMWVEIKGITADGQPVEGKFVINQQ